MARHTRKGRNPGPVDEWLEKLGYYRKNIAYDETCLFRAVSEQMFSCQLFHEKVRRDCIAYAKANHQDFVDIMEKKSDWDTYLGRLKKHMAVCGLTEIHIISKTYKKGILLFDGLKRCMIEICKEYDGDHLLLCKMGEDHYDVVYKREYIQDSGFCQSIVYNILYENVFEIANVDKIVQAMLYQKPPFIASECFENEENNNSVKLEKVVDLSLDIRKSLLKVEEDSLNEYEYMLRSNIAPFPFKVAKALDPNIYRNIEYDTWTEMRKEMRLGDWYYGDNNLIQGSGCILKINGEDFHCYIQEILKNDDRCVVYITSRAEKRTVRLSELHPEADAKPWPLPYRFSKNLMITIPKIELPDKKYLRKKRDKKRTISKCSNDSENIESVEENINVYEGAPLQMQPEPLQYEEVIELATPQTPHNYDWSKGVVSHTPEPAWSQVATSSSPNGFAFNAKPTESQITEPQYYYTPESYPRYNVWTNGEYVAPLPPPDQAVPISPQCVEVPQTPDGFNYFFTDGVYSPTYYANDRQQYVTSVPASPQVEVYQPMYPPAPAVYSASHPVTPVIIAPSPEMMPPPASHIVYSPAIDMSYLQSSPFIYPPTPPTAWYPSVINSQGFIFPTMSTNSNVRN